MQLSVKLDQPTDLAFRIRIPQWATGGMKITGSVTEHVAAGKGYHVIQRQWQDGDRISLTLPRSLRLHRAVDDESQVAFVYGPLVLAAQLGDDELPPDIIGDHMRYLHRPAAPVPTLVAESTDAGELLEPVEDRPLYFRTKEIGQPNDVRLAPLFATHHQRYAVYLRLLSPNDYAAERERIAAAEQAARELAERTVDQITFGEQQPEVEHALESQNSRTGIHAGKPWRQADEGGFFSARLKVNPDKRNTLIVTYWGGDAGRKFDILANDELLESESLKSNLHDQFIDIEYPLPRKFTRSQTAVTITFRPKPGHVTSAYVWRTVAD